MSDSEDVPPLEDNSDNNEVEEAEPIEEAEERPIEDEYRDFPVLEEVSRNGSDEGEEEEEYFENLEDLVGQEQGGSSYDEDVFEDIEGEFEEMDSRSEDEMNYAESSSGDSEHAQEEEVQEEEASIENDERPIAEEEDWEDEEELCDFSTDEPPEKSPSAEKWMNYLKNNSRAILPSFSDELFGHQTIAEKSILEFLIQPEAIVLVEDREYGPRFGKVTVACEDMLKVTFLDNEEEEESDWIDAEQIITDEELLAESLEIFPLEEEDYEFIFTLANIEMTREDILSGKRVYQFIKPGMWLEIQLDLAPHMVTYAKVLKNHGGILEVAYSSYRCWIHMFDPMCHYFGWALDQRPDELEDNQYVMYTGWCTTVNYKHARRREVPRAILYNNGVDRHNLKVGDLLAVTIPENHSIYYTHVTSVLNPHWFDISSGLKDGHLNHASYGPFDIHSSRIFPAAYFENSGIELEPPFGLRRAKNSKKFSWDVYKKMFNLESSSFVPECGSCSLTEDMKIHTFKYIEFLDLQNGGCNMYAAEICRSHRGLLWIRPHYSTGLIVVHAKDDRLFRVGTAMKYGLPIFFENPLERFRIPGDDKWSNVPSSNMNGQKIFVPKYVIDKSGFLPRLYLNRNCSTGMYLIKKAFVALPSFIESGNVEGVLKLVFKYIMNTVVPAKRAIVTHLLQKSIDFDKYVTVMNVKYRSSIKEPTGLIRVGSCVTSGEMPAFLRIVLMTISACPNLFSFDSSDETGCPYECYNDNEIYEDLRVLETDQNKENNISNSSHEENYDDKDEEPQEERQEEEEYCNDEEYDEDEFEDLEGVEYDEERVRQYLEESKNSSISSTIHDSVENEEKNDEQEVITIEDDDDEPSTSDRGREIEDICHDHERALELRLQPLKRSLLTPHAPILPKCSKFVPIAPAKTTAPATFLNSVIYPNKKNVANTTPTTFHKKPIFTIGEGDDSPHNQPSTSTPISRPIPPLPSHFPNNFEGFPSTSTTPVSGFDVNQYNRIHYEFQIAMMQRHGGVMPPMMNRMDNQMKQMKAPRARTCSPDPSQPSTSSGFRPSAVPQAIPPAIRIDKVDKTDKTDKAAPILLGQPSPAFSTCSASSSKNSDPIIVGKPTVAEVKLWDSATLIDYLRSNALNIGSEPIRMLHQQLISGEQLLSMTEEQCIISLRAGEAGSRLYKFIQWLLKP